MRRQFRYYCPICLRYFNYMLISECCHNYLCHYCADEMAEREKNIDTFIATCFNNCETKPFKLKDVDPKERVKKYTDSQCLSFYSNNIGKVTVQSGQGGGFFHISKSKLLKGGGDLTDKENAMVLSPVNLNTPYDPFGDQDYKAAYFQHSASNFLGRMPLGLIGEGSEENGGPGRFNQGNGNEIDEESKQDS